MLMIISPVNPHGFRKTPRSSHHPCAGRLASLGRVAPARAGAAAQLQGGLTVIPPDEWNILPGILFIIIGILFIIMNIYGILLLGYYEYIWDYEYTYNWLNIIDMGVSENSVPLNPMVLLIIIPIKWLFHWEYTQHFQTNPYPSGKLT